MTSFGGVNHLGPDWSLSPFKAKSWQVNSRPNILQLLYDVVLTNAFFHAKEFPVDSRCSCGTAVDDVQHRTDAALNGKSFSEAWKKLTVQWQWQ